MEYTPHLGWEYALLWWLALEAIGLLALPLAFRLFRHLPDRGYALAKPLGLVLVSYLLWMLSTLGLLRNSWGSILLVLGLVGGLSTALYHRLYRRADGITWAREHWRVILASEVVFTAAFVLWTAYKAYDPNIAITEKPMEFAFLNAIGRSERFPAYDPWMSGYGFSYYHLGYIMVATLAKFTGVPNSFAFNLGIVMLFSLTASGAFSVAYNMVHGVAARRDAGSAVRKAISYGIVAAVTIPLMGNLEGALEFAHANGIGVTTREPGNVTGPFWEWIDIHNLTRSGTISDTWYPTDGWWWWRASRVIHDKGFNGGHMEVISEFPAFSFLLGDMHPHVLAYPFIFLALGLALNLLLSRAALETVDWWLVYLCLGSLGFLNTWDLPFYLFIVVMAYGINRYLHPELDAPSWLERLETRFIGAQRGQDGSPAPTPWLRQVIYRAIELGLACVILYLPAWLYSLPKSGSGILPNLFNVTRFAHLFLMFGTFLLALAVLLIAQFAELWRAGIAGKRSLLRRGLAVWAITVLVFPLLLGLVLAMVMAVPSLRGYIEGKLADPMVQQFLGPQTLGSLLRISLRIRLGLLPQELKDVRMPAGLWTFLVLSLLIAAVVTQVLSRLGRVGSARAVPVEGMQSDTTDRSLYFGMLTAFTGLMLVFGVEFVYLRDAFGTRMNTIFKFYFQAWALLGLTAAFALYYVLEARERHPVTRALLSVLFWALVFAGLLYPLGMSINRTGGFAGPATLDGMAFVARDRPEEYAAIQWLKENVSGHPVIVEAVRGSFAYEYARVSSRTGLPAVIGWTGHESQWRGMGEEIARREQDVQTLYGGGVQEALQVMDRYGVTYVYVGYLERAEFGAAAEKFERFMDVAFRAGDTAIYRRR